MPFRQAATSFRVQRLAVAGEAIGNATPPNFVQYIPRRPQAVEIEAARPDVAACHFGKSFLTIFQSTQVTIAVFVLHFLHFPDDIIGPFLDARVVGGGIHQADGGQIMSGDVAGEVFTVAVPTVVAFAWGSRPARTRKYPSCDPVPVAQVIRVPILGCERLPQAHADTAKAWPHNDTSTMGAA